MNARNTILYGPPGTGKTYLSLQKAVAKAERLTEAEAAQKYSSRPALREQFGQYQQQGRIAFVTFHPSFSYEDFVEGIKPFKNERNELYYDIEDGIFKQICYNATYALYQTQQQQHLPKAGETGRKNFDSLYFEFLDYLKRMMQEGSKEVIFETVRQKPVYLESTNKNDTLQFRYPQGKRTYGITKSVMGKLYRHFGHQETIPAADTDFRQIAGSNRSLYLAVFHRLKAFEETRNQTYNYILNSRPLHGSSSTEQYLHMKSILSRFDMSALSPEDYVQADHFVLIIDEINRGNIAGIFGELITLLEEDKRAGMSEALQTVLPYSRERFSVPPNLSVIGTMNTADRSIETIDTALRRRFFFQEIRPQPALLRTPVDPEAAKASVAAEAEAVYDKKQPDLPLDVLLEVLNLRLEKLLDREHTIGHGYFLPVLQADDPWQKLQQVFYQQIIPLLQEYFFSDETKIAWVLGEAFVEQIGNDTRYPTNAAWQEEYGYKPVLRIKRLDGEAFRQAITQIYD